MTFAAPKRRQQFGVIPYRQIEDSIEVLLITSRGTGRWVLPKGWPMQDKRPHRAAEIEAYEEAGVVGKASKKSVGGYDYTKDGFVPCRVILFALPVDQLLSEWPEDRGRQRQWSSRCEASERVAEPELRAVLLRFEPGQLDVPRKASTPPVSSVAWELRRNEPWSLPLAGTSNARAIARHH